MGLGRNTSCYTAKGQKVTLLFSTTHRSDQNQWRISKTC